MIPSLEAVDIAWSQVPEDVLVSLPTKLSARRCRTAVRRQFLAYARQFHVHGTTFRLHGMLRKREFVDLISVAPSASTDAKFAQYFPHLTPNHAAMIGRVCNAALLSHVWDSAWETEEFQSREGSIGLEQRFLAEHEQALGEDHLDTIRVAHNLALSYQAAERLEESAPIMERVVAGYSKTTRAGDSDASSARTNLGALYVALHRYEEAVPFLEQLLRDPAPNMVLDRERLLPARASLTNAYASLGMANETIEHGELVLAESEDLNAADDLITAACRHTLSIGYEMAERFDEAVVARERAGSGCSGAVVGRRPRTHVDKSEQLGGFVS